ncbi:Protein tipElike, partial [Caligus rogercresseyi]
MQDILDHPFRPPGRRFLLPSLISHPFHRGSGLATILADFTSENVSCSVSEVAYRQGLGNCSWSSCREGCTRDVYTCFQVSVTYRDLQGAPAEGFLFVNARGCGYPPKVKCDSFYEQYEYLHRKEQTFDCYYSQRNRSIVVTEVDLPGQVLSLSLSICVPLFILFLSCVALALIQKFIRFKEDSLFVEG